MTQPLTKRDEIVQYAYEAFYKHGFRATAVDKVLADSGISKRTVYKYFPSKELLIAAAIEHYQTILFATITEELARRGATPQDKILALFDIKHEAFERGDYSGCFALNAKLEYEGKDAAIEKASATFGKALEKFITTLCAEAGCKDAAFTAKQITILFHGVVVYAQAQRDAVTAITAKEMARALLKAN